MALEKPPQRPPTAGESTEPTVSAEELLELVGDEYTRRVLEAVAEQPRSGREVMEAADVSKATAYRRLNDLKDAGVLETEMVIDPDGHHHERYHAVIDRAELPCTDSFADANVTLVTDGGTPRE